MLHKYLVPLWDVLQSIEVTVLVFLCVLRYQVCVVQYLRYLRTLFGRIMVTGRSNKLWNLYVMWIINNSIQPDRVNLYVNVISWGHWIPFYQKLQIPTIQYRNGNFHYNDKKWSTLGQVTLIKFKYYSGTWSSFRSGHLINSKYQPMYILYAHTSCITSSSFN